MLALQQLIPIAMTNLRIIRHDRPDQVLAECQSAVVPARGEVLQLDVVDPVGEVTGPSTLWRIVSVTLHVPSLSSATPENGTPLCVRLVEVAVLPDVAPIPELAQAAEHILSESRM